MFSIGLGHCVLVPTSKTLVIPDNDKQLGVPLKYGQFVAMQKKIRAEE